MNNMSKPIQLSLFGIHLDEYGNFIAPNGVVVTKSYLTIALKYRSVEEVAEQLLDLTLEELFELLEFFGIDHKKIVPLTPQRIKIMEVTQRYLDKYGTLPTLRYLKARTKLKMDELERELAVLTACGYIKYRKGVGIQQLVRAV